MLGEGLNSKPFLVGEVALHQVDSAERAFTQLIEGGVVLMEGIEDTVGGEGSFPDLEGVEVINEDGGEP